MSEYVIGVDGGNSKTEAVVATTTGRVLARVRGPGVDSPLTDRVRWRQDMCSLLEDALREARPGRARTVGPPAPRTSWPTSTCRRSVASPRGTRCGRAGGHHGGAQRHRRRSPGRRQPTLGRRGGGRCRHQRGRRAPSGRVARFLALGDYTGDAGGGHDLGLKGLAAAIRAGDGRGPATVLTTAVPRHFGLRRPHAVAIAVHSGEIPYDELHVLAPVVFAASSGGDPVARGLLTDFGTEVAVMACATIRRLHLTRTELDVVLGGGTLQVIDSWLLDHITSSILAVAPHARVRTLDVPPVFGALVEALSRTGASPPALRKLRRELTRPAPARVRTRPDVKARRIP